MKYQLTHKQTEIIQITGLIITGILPWIITLALIQFLPLTWCIIGAVIVNSVTFYFSLRFYKAEFDTDFLYLTRRLNKRKIDLKDVKEVRAFPFPVHLFFGTAYIISLSYIDTNRRKTVFVISRRSTSLVPTIDTLQELTRFREYVQNKKYGR